MVIVVERAFEAFFHVDHPGETSRLKRLAGIARANAAAADEEDRAGHVADQQMFDLVGEVRRIYPRLFRLTKGNPQFLPVDRNRFEIPAAAHRLFAASETIKTRTPGERFALQASGHIV